MINEIFEFALTFEMLKKLKFSIFDCFDIIFSSYFFYLKLYDIFDKNIAIVNQILYNKWNFWVFYDIWDFEKIEIFIFYFFYYWFKLILTRSQALARSESFEISFDVERSVVDTKLELYESSRRKPGWRFTAGLELIFTRTSGEQQAQDGSSINKK